VRAAYYIDHLPEPSSKREAVAEILSVMHNAAQPFGTVDPARPNVSSTVWRTVVDFESGMYFFESSFSPTSSGCGWGTSTSRPASRCARWS
jgi:penicillin V acylase-like amidase (Ntn superfamily)